MFSHVYSECLLFGAAYLEAKYPMDLMWGPKINLTYKGITLYVHSWSVYLACLLGSNQT